MNQIIGHKEILDTLSSRQKNHKLPQAIIFSGPEGIGKNLIVWDLAQKLLCEKQTACGECISCHQVKSRIHPDLFVVAPPPKKKLIPVDLVREMEAWEPILPVVKRGKVVIVSPANALTEESQNALLKLLEEPHQEVYFLLVSNDHKSILNTIMTRCFELKMKALSEEELKQIAQSLSWPIPTVIDLQMAKGSARKLSLLLNYKFSTFTQHLIQNLSTASAIDVLQLTQGMFEFFSELQAAQDANGEEKMTDHDFAKWLLDLLRLMLEDGARLAEGEPVKYFTAKEIPSFNMLMQRSSRDHHLKFAQELRELDRDLSLNLPAISVVEAAFFSFYQNRFTQKN